MVYLPNMAMEIFNQSIIENSLYNTALYLSYKGTYNK